MVSGNSSASLENIKATQDDFLQLHPKWLIYKT